MIEQRNLSAIIYVHIQVNPNNSNQGATGESLTSDSFRGIVRLEFGASFVVGFAKPLINHSISFDPRENLSDSNRTVRTSSTIEKMVSHVVYVWSIDNRRTYSSQALKI